MMASSSSTVKSTSSSEDSRPITAVADERKRKRMLSNRESARRSRMRKQKHLDDLTAQITQLTNDNRQIMTTLNVTTQLYTKIQAENSVLNAQLSELNSRLQSLNEIVDFVAASTSGAGIDQGMIDGCCGFDDRTVGINDGFGYDDMLCGTNPWGGSVYVNQPIMANDHMNMY